MKINLYKLDFETGVHFGENSLEDSNYVFCADTLFSALCQEAVKRGKECLDELVKNVQDGKLLISDALPYIGNTLFIPKPFDNVIKADGSKEYVMSKAYRNMKYLPIDMFDKYMNGEIIESDLDELGVSEQRNQVSIRGEEESRPYRTGVYYYKEGNGLYIIVEYDGDIIELFEELLDGLSLSGIGGKRSQGLGRFILKKVACPDNLAKRLLNKDARRYMTLSVALPCDDELEETLEKARYNLIKRSGFVSSDIFSDKQLKKRDLYVFEHGSCFDKCFNANMQDVSDSQGIHPVYKYTHPLFFAL